MVRCSACSGEVPEGRFCLACGRPLLPSSEAPTRYNPATPGRSPSSPDHGRFFPGKILGDRYRIVALLGRGGMGEVYRADDLKLGQPVALKFLPREIERDEARLARLLNEVRTARQVAHPNVCRVYDVAETEGSHFLSMEYVDGEDLASLLRRIGRLPTDKGVQIARQISAGVAAAHDAGVLHRDLKPSNILIDGRGRARVTDFGLAALGGEVGEDEVRSGTPAYMAPEQLAGKEVTTRSDLYSLGLVLYELFTGRQPFRATNPAELLRLQTTSSPASPSSVVDGIDPAVERVILRCLDSEPARRPASALAVAAALPGGDPLAAALAAGETPSPELVAAAGDTGGMSPAAAGGLLAVTLAGLALLVFAAGKTQVVRLVPLAMPPAVLAEKAREVLRAAGPEQPVRDSLAAFEYDHRYLRRLRETTAPAERDAALSRAQPAAIHFRYRQSPRYLYRENNGSIGNWFVDPPPTLPGMAEVTLDPRGRLIAFSVVPPAAQASDGPAAGADWSPLLHAAGLDPAALSRTEALGVPPVFADHRAAWEGTYPESPDVAIRVDAASLGGRPVVFRISEPWELEAPSRKVEEGPPFLPGRILRVVVFLGAVGGAAFVALRNLRTGRGDRRGALRFALYLGTVRLAWIVGAHHLPTDAEIGLLIAHIAWSTYRVGMVALLYLALEPYARRLWPRMLVSWMRVLDGSFRDPLVGRHLLIGCSLGIAIALWKSIPSWLAPRLPVMDFPLPSEFWTLEAIRGFRHSVAALLGIHTMSVMNLFFPLMLLLIFRLLLRRTWASVTVTSLVGALIYYPGTGSLMVFSAFALVVIGLFWFALFRYGLLPAILAITLADFLEQMPLTFDVTAWYAAPSLLTLALVAGLALFGFRSALAGRLLIRDAVLDAEPAR